MEIRPRILLVEDDLTVQAMAEACLRCMPAQVVCAGDAAAALAAPAGFEAVVLDVNLPGEDGFSVCRKLLERPDPPPVVFLTSREAVADRLRAFEAGAADYVTKPFSPEELVARVRTHVRRDSARRAVQNRARLLELRERTRQELTDYFVHDLKSPLSSIMGTLSLLKEEGAVTDAMLARFVAQSNQSAQFMVLLLNDMMDLRRSESAGFKPVSSKFRLGDLKAKLQSLFDIRLAQYQIQAAYAFDPSEESVAESDFQLIFRIAVNLIANAVKHAFRGGALDVALACRNGRLTVAVADRGPGIPETLKPVLFERSYRGRSASETDLLPGSGLGLSFCRMASEALGGTVTAADRPGGGSVFTLDIPAQAV